MKFCDYIILGKFCHQLCLQLFCDRSIWLDWNNMRRELWIKSKFHNLNCLFSIHVRINYTMQEPNWTKNMEYILWSFYVKTTSVCVMVLLCSKLPLLSPILLAIVHYQHFSSFSCKLFVASKHCHSSSDSSWQGPLRLLVFSLSERRKIFGNYI